MIHTNVVRALWDSTNLAIETLRARALATERTYYALLDVLPAGATIYFMNVDTISIENWPVGVPFDRLDCFYNLDGPALNVNTVDENPWK